MDFVKHGGHKTEASQIYKVGCRSVYRWLQHSDLKPL
ncbi:MAG: hypothetical protein HQL68_03580 [Magnetococcales bacterium]|nr:hypothetical protein [Magnetococcales bacterium]